MAHLSAGTFTLIQFVQACVHACGYNYAAFCVCFNEVMQELYIDFMRVDDEFSMIANLQGSMMLSRPKQERKS